MQSRNKFGRSACALAAASVVVAGTQAALAGFSSITSFVPNPNNTSPYIWNDATNVNWDTGIPTATSLARIANTAAISSGGNMVAYGVEFTSTGGNVTITPSPSTDVLTLLSMDSVADPDNGLAFALSNVASASGTLEVRPAIQLGDGSVSSGTFYFNNTRADGALNIYHKVVQAPGTTMGLTITGTNRVEIRAGTNSGNYLTNRYNFTGPFTIAAGAHARVYNNVLPYGQGLPNVQINGQFRQSANGNAIILNAIDSADSTAIISRQAGNDLVIGANGNNGNFSGALNSSATRLVKIGQGTQVLSNATSVHGAITLLEGVLEVSSIADSGVASAAGGGANGGSFTYNSVTYTIPGTQLDGGTLRYTGGGNTSNRAIGVSFRGGTIESSGSGPLTLSGTLTANDFARVYGDSLESGTGQIISNMYGLNGLSSLASQLVIAEQGTSINAAVGTTPVAIDEINRTLELASGATVGTAGNGFGAPRLHLLSTTGIARTLTLGGTNDGDNTISSVLADSALAGGSLGITKTGPGKWILSGANTYSGPTNVNAGTLLVNGTHTGTGTVTVNAGGTLGGSGSIAGAVNSVGGKVAPGNSAGTFTVGSVSLDAASTYAVELESISSFDKLVVNGAASVAGSMTIDLLGGYEPAHADTFAIITSSGLTGTFANTNAWGMIPAGTGKAFLPEYTATDVVLKEFTKVGDLDFDGLINNQDIAPFVAVLTGTPPVAPSSLGFAADVNGDGVVNNQDIAPFVALLTGGPNPVSDADLAPLMSLVPEPASLSLLALGALALRRRRA